MDTSFSLLGPITWAQVVALAAFLIGIGKLVDWLVGKLKGGTAAAVPPPPQSHRWRSRCRRQSSMSRP